MKSLVEDDFIKELCKQFILVRPIFVTVVPRAQVVNDQPPDNQIRNMKITEKLTSLSVDSLHGLYFSTHNFYV